MSKKFPQDIDYREALPCEHCKCALECFNVTTKYIGCPNCERQYPLSRAIMRFENMHREGDKVVTELWAGPEKIDSGTIEDVMQRSEAENRTIDGVNYSTYTVKRQTQRASKPKTASR